MRGTNLQQSHASSSSMASPKAQIQPGRLPSSMASPMSQIQPARRGSPPGSSILPAASSPHRIAKNGRLYAVSDVVQAPAVPAQEKSVAAKAVVTVKPTSLNLLSFLLDPTNVLDCISNLLGKPLLLDLVAAELDPKTGAEIEPIKAYARLRSNNSNEMKFEAEFVIKPGFGEVGAVLVTNENRNEMFLEEIVVTGFASGAVAFPCNSWVHAKSDSPEKRIFFLNKTYLPSQTPSGLQRLREKELQNLRGDGEGERKSFERIYDYDVYNDLGNPDVSDDLKRPVLGGSQRPYPRRCRTGRPKSEKDPESETRTSGIYVPRDEQFSALKQSGFALTTVESAARAVLQSLDTVFAGNISQGFDFFTDIDKLFNDGLDLGPPPTGPRGLYRLLLPRLIKAIRDRGDNILQFDTPALMERDRFSWLRDEEFGRQMLAGLNPYSIQLVTEFPFVSKLDPKIYGLPKSEITKEIIERQIKGCMTVEEAVTQKRLFVLDYHDLLLPYVHMVRDLEGTTLYGSRTVFFLTNEGTLQPLAIELTRPASGTKPQWKKAFTPGICGGDSSSTTTWLWKFAKAHVSAHDLGYHELVSHWLRTHASIEPYIIAVNRQLSAMHPIHRLIRPHLRYTMQINALARGVLISAGGIIERSFSTKKYSMRLSADAYAQNWRFDMEGLPADLIRRGMAVKDPTAPHGLRLTIEDYPFAADGLLIWSAIEQWVTEYVAHYYPNDEMVSSDTELQAWWTEVRTRGHGDKKDEPWWPTLTTPEDLTQVLTTIIWVASAHHAAVNFGQYDYGGYFPNRPSILRTNMPVEDEEEEQLEKFWKTPERALLEGLPSQFQATVVMATLNLLSTHSQDEEYLGKLPASAWSDNPAIGVTFENFKARLEEIERIIDERNQDRNLRNRSGVGMIPYELMKPFSKPGVTGMGIPNSTSI